MSKTTLPSLNRLSVRISSTLKLTAALAAALAVFCGQDADAATLTWIGSTGASSNVWDVGTTTNWLSAGVPAVFNNGDAVVFDDTGTNIPTVKLTTTVLPASVTVNSAGTYTFTNSSGSGIGGSGKLIKLGSAMLNLRGANTYSGGTTNTGYGGRLQVFDANALGTGALTINGGGGLNFVASVAAGNGGLGLTNNIIVLVDCGNNVFTSAGKLSGKISGPGSCDWNGFTSGSLALSGDNSGWSGNFSFSGPGITLYLGHTNALGSGTVTMGLEAATMKPILSAAADLSGGLGVRNAIVVRGNPLTFNLTNDLLLSGPISGASNFVKTGSAALILSGSNTFTGNLTNTAGMLKLGSSNALGFGTLVMNGGTLGTVAAVTLTNNVVMAADSAVANTNNLTLNGVISGSAALTKSGSAALIFSSFNTLTGRILVNGGTLAVSGAGAAIPFASSITVTNEAQLNFGQTGTNGMPLTLTGKGSGSSWSTGMGPLCATASSIIKVTYDGAITLAAAIAGDIVRIGGYSASGSHTSVFNGIISGNGSLALFSGGVGNNHSGLFLFNNHSTYTGDTTLVVKGANCVAMLGIDEALPATTELAMYSSVFGGRTNYSQTILNGHNQTLAGIASIVDTGATGTNRISGGNATLSTLTISNAVDDTFDGVLGGGNATDNNLALVKTGVGELTLTRANTYSGGTTVSNGFLNVANTGGSGTGSGFVSVKSGGSLSGTGIITGAVTVNSGGTLSPGDAGIGQLRISNALTLAAGSTTVMELNKIAGTNDAVVGPTSVSYGGTLTVPNLGGALAAGDSFKLFNAASYSGSFAAIVPAAPGAWLAWDTSTLATDGTLRIVAACEVSILSQPVGRAAVVGSAVSFSVVAHTTTGVTNYQWQFAGLPISGATNRTLVLNSLQATNFGPYAVVVGNGLCSVPSQTAQLTQAVRPSFLPTRLNGTTISMSFPTELGPVYVVEYKDALDDATWQVLNTLNGTGNTELVTDTIANALTRFYRIRMQ